MSDALTDAMKSSQDGADVIQELGWVADGASIVAELINAMPEGEKKETAKAWFNDQDHGDFSINGECFSTVEKL